MAKIDKDYIKLCETILDKGTWAHNRTGTDTIMIPSYYLHFDLSKEFPILTTKQVFIRQAVLEMLWIWQVQSNDVRWLQDRNVHIWDEWEISLDGKWHYIVKEIDNDGHVIEVKKEKKFGKEYAHTIGTAYGYIVKKYHLMDSLLDTIKNNPEDRRMVKSLWQDAELDTAVLPSCVWSSEWDVTDGKLNLWVHQRSCDVPLGLPFNITQYSVLLCMLAQVCNLKPGTIDWSIKNAHIYKNQIEGIKEQIRRFHEEKDYKAPKLWLNPDIKNFYDFDNSTECKDVKLIDYQNHGKISFEITQ
jgi:thymidylate synthase